jgi:hypothetical protein
LLRGPQTLARPGAGDLRDLLAVPAGLMILWPDLP